MKHYKLIFLLAFSILITSNLVASGSYIDNMSGNYKFSNDKVEIHVTGNGNVPKYKVTLLETNTSYNVFFNALFTANDTNNDGVFQEGLDKKVSKPDGGFSVALPSSSWDFSDVSNTSDGGVTFDINSTDLGIANKGKKQTGAFDDAQISLRNTISGTNANEIKFDVILSGFDLSGIDGNPIIVFAYTLTSGTGNNGTQTGYTVDFGVDGYFSSEPTAEADSGIVNVGMSSTSIDNNTRVYLSYPAFEGELVHDPTVGVQTRKDKDDDSDGDGIKDSEDKDDDNDGVDDTEDTNDNNGVNDNEDTEDNGVKDNEDQDGNDTDNDAEEDEPQGPKLGSEEEISQEAPFPFVFATVILVLIPILRRSISNFNNKIDSL